MAELTVFALQDMIRGFSPPGLKDKIYLDIAQSLMYCKPALIVPTDTSEKSIRKKRIYNSPTEMYTLVEAALDEDIQGIYTPFTRCYSMSCLPGQPGCYSASCPNKIYSLNGFIFKKPTAVSVVSSSSHDTVSSFICVCLCVCKIDVNAMCLDSLTCLVSHYCKGHFEIYA